VPIANCPQQLASQQMDTAPPQSAQTDFVKRFTKLFDRWWIWLIVSWLPERKVIENAIWVG
jgi:hypothetical protein